MTTLCGAKRTQENRKSKHQLDAETFFFNGFQISTTVGIIIVLKQIVKMNIKEQACGQCHFARCCANMYIEWA